MQLPPTITFRGIEATPALEADVRRRIEKLETYYAPIMACRVLIELGQRHHEAGNRYHVRIDLTVPGDELVVAHDAGLHTNARDLKTLKTQKHAESDRDRRHAHVAVREAFEVARRRLQDFARRQRGAVKTSHRLPHGRIVRLFPEEGYGFIRTADGHDVYFQRNSVLNDAFARLTLGMDVSFAEERGDKGLQASTVKLASHAAPRRAPAVHTASR